TRDGAARAALGGAAAPDRPRAPPRRYGRTAWRSRLPVVSRPFVAPFTTTSVELSPSAVLFRFRGLRVRGQPFGCIAAELRRRPGPVGLRFGEPQDWAEMPQRAALR